MTIVIFKKMINIDDNDDNDDENIDDNDDENIDDNDDQCFRFSRTGDKSEQYDRLWPCL